MTQLSDETKRLTDNLISHLMMIGSEAENQAKRETLLNEFDLKLRSRERVLDEREERIRKKEEILADQEEYLSVERGKLEREKKLLDESKNKLKEETQQLHQKSEGLQIREELVDKKITTYHDLKSREAKVKSDMEVIEKEKTIDRERKKILDIKEKELTDRGIYLQKLADKMKGKV